MRRLFTIILIILSASAFTGCVVVHDEPPVVVAQPPHVDVAYDFWTGSRSVEVDGEIFNDGPGFAQTVELEFRFFNKYGDWVDTDYRTFHLDLPPGHSANFYADFGYWNIYDVDVRVAGVSF